ncbi:MAG TPA: TIM barrel protein [Bryobacteraceae bacterium]|nr:TIM barrel protein [Bryobacteraceae bacterium]
MISRRAFAMAAPALLSRAEPAASKLKVAIFSKHLQFLHGEELARGAADLGFDGVDLTVRKGGHVEPERVRQDLPPLVKIIRDHGLETPMITAGIIDADSPQAEDILKAMADLGIRNYRWGDLRLAADQPLAIQLERMKPRVAKLAALNARYGACAMYHTHSGLGLVGASIWDLYILLKDFDPGAVAVNYDIGHATVEGGLAGWINSFRITGQYLRGIAVKDFLWEKDARGNWQPQWKPLGEGMVRFPQFFGMVAQAGFAGPLQLHFEYPLGGANDGRATLTMPREQVFGAMKQDLTKLRGYLAQANL